MEYFDRPGSLTLGAALDPEQLEREKKEQAERQRIEAKKRDEDERKQRQREMQQREHERIEREKAEKRAKEAARQEAIQATLRAEEEKAERKREEEEKKHKNKEKQKQREEEKKRAEAKVEAEARERRKKFEKEQAQMDEIKEINQRAARAEAGEEDAPEDEEYRRELQKSMDEAAAMASGATLAEVSAQSETLFWTPEGAGATTLPPGPPGFDGGLGAEQAAFVGGLMGGGQQGQQPHRGNTAAQIAKLQAQVTSLQESLSHTLAEVACEQNLRKMEEERLNRVRQGVLNRQNELSIFQACWDKQLVGL